RITRELGAGGMGVVYEAVDTKLDRTVAIKFLPPESTRNPDAKARFVHEAKAASALDHNNVCVIHEIDETDDGQLFLVMARYEGETLKDRIERGPLPLSDALDITRQVAEGLTKAHERDIVHRDIKPANIFITEDGVVKILDFGLAKLAGQTLLTKTGTTLGTAGYMSPEQARGDETDQRTDLWCLGVVLYEMMTGQLPFKGDHEQAIVYAILNQDPEPVTGLRTGVPLTLEQLIGRCLEKEPGARYQTAGDLASDLGRVRRGLVSADQPTVTLPGRARPHRRRSLAAVGSVLGAVLVLGVLLVGLNVGNLRERLLGEEGESPIRSLAVLPLDNMMGDTEQDFFVEGMHEALITELSKIGTLRVISRTTAMYYRDTDKSIPEIARELDVDALVEGSVLRVGDRVRITAQLIRGGNDEHLWAEDYDRDLRDILNLLSEVARSIAGEIHVTLTPRQQERLTTDRTVDPDVYEMYLRGIHHLYKLTEMDVLESRRLFQQAIGADPDFAQAHVGLAGTYVVNLVVRNQPARDLYPLAPLAREAVQRALELDPGLGTAHSMLGFAELYFNWDWAAAELEFHRALELDPNDGPALHGLAGVLIVYGRFDEAVDLVKRARQFDPYNFVRNLSVCGYLGIARRFEEVATEVERWRGFSGDSTVGWSSLFKAYFHQGRYEEAMVELRHSSTARDPESAPIMEEAYAKSGIQGAFLVCAERLVALSQREYIKPLDITLYFALAGDADQTFVWLEKVYEERTPTIYMLAQPALDPYRSDPRFRELMGKMGIPESGWERLGSGGK
ncbi:MAG: protein kinase, partial [Acidobacteria bacterium]|nr:protein kinase [Candidatus Sulfomarinibacter kjeldsenii]